MTSTKGAYSRGDFFGIHQWFNVHVAQVVQHITCFIILTSAENKTLFALEPAASSDDTSLRVHTWNI